MPNWRTIIVGVLFMTMGMFVYAKTKSNIANQKPTLVQELQAQVSILIRAQGLDTAVIKAMREELVMRNAIILELKARLDEKQPKCYKAQGKALDKGKG